MQSAKGTREGFYVKLNSKKTLPFFPLWPAGLEGGFIIHWTTDLRADRSGLTALSTLAEHGNDAVQKVRISSSQLEDLDSRHSQY